MKVAFYPSHLDKVPTIEDLSWQELAQRLSTHRPSACTDTPCGGRNCRSKNGPSWSPVDLAEAYCVDENVRAVTAAVFDLDHQRAEDLTCLEKVEQSGHAYVVYSTHSHRPPDNYSLRVVFPVSRPIPVREWARVRSAIAHLFGFKADDKTKNPSRIYYMPTVQPGVDAIYDAGNGLPLDVDELLASTAQGTAPRATPALAASTTASAATSPTDMHELASVLVRRAKPENKEIIRAALKGEPLPLGEQDDRIQRLMGTAAFVLPDTTPDEAILELFRACFNATDWREPGGPDHLAGEALKKLQRARERRKARDEEALKENAASWTALGVDLQAVTTAPPRDEGVEDPDAWAGELITAKNKRVKELEGEEAQIKVCEANVYAVLRYSREWRGVLRFNEVTKEIEHSGGPLRSGTSTDGLDVEIAVWFQNSQWGRLGMMPKPSMVRDIIRQVANANAYDPLRDYLVGLEWDGTPRVDGFLKNYFGVTEDEDHVRTISLRWLVSAVARALKPGCKVDTVLILEGGQGVKKSSALRALGGEFFTDQSLDIQNKDSWALASRFWLIELGEGDALFKRADASALKAFITRNEDTYRPPYGRVNVKFPRRSVFIASTNLDDYLKGDPSGYRRLWPVRCGSVDLDALKADAPQIWAEAVVRYRQGVQWWVTDAEAKRAEEIARRRVESTDDPNIEIILRWLRRMVPEKRPREVTILQIAEGAFGITAANLATGKSSQIGRALSMLRWKRVQRRLDDNRVRFYVVPQEELDHPMT